MTSVFRLSGSFRSAVFLRRDFVSVVPVLRTEKRDFPFSGMVSAGAVRVESSDRLLWLIVASMLMLASTTKANISFRALMSIY